MFNFMKKQPKNPVDQFSVDELRAARVRMEHNRDKLLKEIRGLENQKADIFQQGAGTQETRSRRIAAQRIKETEEQIRQLDQQLTFYEKQLQVVSRLEFLKRNRDQMVEMGIDKLLGSMDTGELRKYVEEVSLTGAVSMERLDELSSMLGEALNTGLAGESDPEIARLMFEMERASLGGVSELDGREDSAQTGETAANREDRGENRERN
jgi:hypothetical protein